MSAPEILVSRVHSFADSAGGIVVVVQSDRDLSLVAQGCTTLRFRTTPDTLRALPGARSPEGADRQGWPRLVRAVAVAPAERRSGSLYEAVFDAPVHLTGPSDTITVRVGSDRLEEVAAFARR
ncbi:hypothetical protein QDR37_07425 [Amnibacterium sp. CER49]|uniref:hypothetical protein n=1 Tax=Amnibacterium sp. CER49 TaxID=3039161 RepID=UPI00244ACBF0|nr:hypothetical protein [Amnibacterium sp. CER49]MDH2443772.1 hypothetical protein [Amnibacterium sp. CER49]